MLLHISIDRNSSIPFHEQIKDQIKLALVLGRLRPGDNLPSIRQLDTELKVGIPSIRRAYQELAKVDVLSLQHGRGVFVKNGLRTPTETLVRQYEELCRNVFDELDSANQVPSAFARFFFNKALETERRAPSVVFVEDSCTLSQDYAEEVSRVWQIPVAGVSIDQLRQLAPARRAALRRVLTTYYHLDEVRETMQRQRARVFPVDVEFSGEMLTDIEALGKEGRVLCVLEHKDYQHQSSFILDFLREALGATGVQFSCAPATVESLPKLLSAHNDARFYISNRIWDHLDEATKSHAAVRRFRLRVNQEALREVWSTVGVI